jgi:hypothetical protein
MVKELKLANSELKHQSERAESAMRGHATGYNALLGEAQTQSGLLESLERRQRVPS